MYRIRQYIRPEQIREFSLIFIIILVVLFFGTQIEGYFSARTFDRVASSVAIITVIAVGQTLVILTRNIDLSVGSIVGFAAYYAGQQVSLHQELSPIAVIGLAVAFGAILGAINGVIVAYARVPSIITTLGTLAIYRGILVEYAQAKTITTQMMPQWLLDLPRQNLLTIGDVQVRVMVGLAIVVVIVAQLSLNYLRFGRRLYAIGSNPDAARIAGLPSRRLVMMTYILCGALSGLAGFMFLVRFGTITVSAGQGLELSAVAAAVVGGVNTFGGSGTAFGTLLGAVVIGTLQQSLLRMQNVSQFVQDALLGLFILLAVASDSVILARLRKVWAGWRETAKQKAMPASTPTEEDSSHAAQP
ncbi:MAG: ABC transporter permease [Chloroflexota bacterium]